MTPSAPLPDVWFTRDLPVLRAIARLVDSSEHGSSPYLLGAVVPASGLPKADVVAAAQALAAAGYIEPLTNHAGDIVRITAISAEARRLAGLWPTPQGEWDRLLEQLTARAEQRADRRRAAALAGLRRRRDGRRARTTARCSCRRSSAGTCPAGAERGTRARNDSAPARRTGRGRWC